MLLRILSFGCCLAGAGLSQAQTLPKTYKIVDSTPQKSPQTSPQTSVEVDVSGSQQWTDTGLDVLPGARLAITASGSLQYAEAQAVSPEGLTRGWKDLLRVLPLNGTGRGALIGRIGTGDLATPFAIGATREVRANRPGRLFLGVNQVSSEPSEGSYHVAIQVLEVGSANAPVLSDLAADTTQSVSIPGIDRELFAKIPRRIGDMQGNPGDMVNFLMVGTEDQVKKAFGTAGWVAVDKTKRDAVLHGLIATLSKQAYVELPMSELYLFDRPQDYGFAHAEPFAVVASRHHLRIWRAPFDVDGRALWVGAATHDIGFDKDQRNNGVTHKIDPNIDDERKYVAQTLADSGVVARIGYFTPPEPLTEARTATGGSFHSDGKVLILDLAAPVDSAK